ncbi:MAG: T9SS type A sorting domain-containing protein [bacterium]
MARIGSMLCLLPALVVGPIASADDWTSVGPDGGPVDGFAQSVIDPDRFYLLSPADGLLRSTDHGATWTAPSPGLDASLAYGSLTVSSGSAEIVLVAERNGDGVWRSIDHGTNWERIGVGPIQHLAFDPAAANRVLACVAGPNADLYESTDAGETWSRLEAGLGIPREIAWNPQIPSDLLVGAPPHVFRSTDGGVSWVAADLGGESSGGLVAFGAGSPSEAWTLSSEGALLLRSTDGGSSFEPRGRPPGCVPRPDGLGWTCYGDRIAGDASQSDAVTVAYSVRVGGNEYQPRVTTTQNGGASWSTPWSPLFAAVIHTLQVTLTPDRATADVRYFAVGGPTTARRGLSRSTDGGNTWAGSMDGIGRLRLDAVRQDGHGGLIARGMARDGLWKTWNGGDTWEDLSDSPPSIFTRSSFYVSTFVPDLLYETGWNNSTDTQDPVVRRSTDGGASWQYGLIEVTYENGWSADPRLLETTGDGRRVFLWCSAGTPYLTRCDVDPDAPDAAPQFRIIHEGFLAADAYVESAGTVWAIRWHLPGDVQLSTDGGVTWIARADGLPADRGVALLPRPTTSDSGAETSLVAVYREAGTFRTTDAGRSWESISLPGYAGETIIAAEQDFDGDRVFLATANAVYVQGQGFVSAGLPESAIRSLAYDPSSDFLFVATDGSGVFRLAPGSAVWSPSPSPSASPFALSTHPNPATRSTTIRFSLPEAGPVALDVFDVSGRRLRSLLDESRHLSAGPHEFRWGDDVSAGVYFIRLQQGPRSETRRTTLLDGVRPTR